MRNINYLTIALLSLSLPLCPAGLPDMVLSALLQEQVGGITPEAIALISPKKMAVSSITCFKADF